MIERLKTNRILDNDEFIGILETDRYDADLYAEADRIRREYYGTDVYIRGLIEFTNHCKNNCYYCGIRAGNENVLRYRLDKETVLDCCDNGYRLGYRTFVLQGGEDSYFKDKNICDMVYEIKSKYTDCAVTLSIGEKEKTSYQEYYRAGADRYLLRQETSNLEHYKMLHPDSMFFEHRKRCLYDLKEIGYQVGAGLMVGSPYQTYAHIVQDLKFLKDLQPDMVGIGPYLTHKDTPFSQFPNGSFHLTLRLIAILRIMFPYALIPATTALGTIAPNGRELGLKAGANVVMPNLSPVTVRKQYELYDNKICTGEEAAECRGCLERRVVSAGYQIVTDIGNVRKKKRNGIL